MYKNGFQFYLNEMLQQRAKARPGYSLRAFARDLEISPSELSLILNGKRNASLNTIEKTLERTSAPMPLKEKLVAEWRSRRGSKIAKTAPPEFMLSELQISLEQMALLGSSLTLSVLEVLRLKRYRSKRVTSTIIDQIADDLQVSTSDVANAIQLLKKHGLVEPMVKGVVLYPESTPNSTVRNYHRQVLNRCATAIDEQSMEERVNVTAQIPIQKKNLEAIRKEITLFQNRLIRKYGEKENGDDVLLLTTAGTLACSNQKVKKEKV